MKRRRLLALLVALLAFGVYSGFYVRYRLKKEILHFKSWSSHNHHSVQAEATDGRLLFILSMMAMSDGTNAVDRAKFEHVLDQAASRADNRRKTLSIIFAPLRWTETCFWYVIDWKRDN